MIELKPYLPEHFETIAPDQVRSIVPDVPAHTLIQLPERKRIEIDLLPLERLELVLKECKALQGLVQKARTTVLSHGEGFALVWIAQRFRGGREWIRKHLQGWAKSAEDEKQLDQSERRGYAPLSCAAMQRGGLCSYPHPEACLSRKFRNGVAVDPSPIRFAYNTTNEKEELRALVEKIRGRNG